MISYYKCRKILLVFLESWVESLWPAQLVGFKQSHGTGSTTGEPLKDVTSMDVTGVMGKYAVSHDKYTSGIFIS